MPENCKFFRKTGSRPLPIRFPLHNYRVSIYFFKLRVLSLRSGILGARLEYRQLRRRYMLSLVPWHLTREPFIEEKMLNFRGCFGYALKNPIAPNRLSILVEPKPFTGAISPRNCTRSSDTIPSKPKLTRASVQNAGHKTPYKTYAKFKSFGELSYTFDFKRSRQLLPDNDTRRTNNKYM